MANQYDIAHQLRVFAVLLKTDMLSKARSYISPDIFDSEVVQNACKVILNAYDRLGRVPSADTLVVEAVQQLGQDEGVQVIQFFKRANSLDTGEVEAIYKPQLIDIVEACAIQRSLREQQEALELGDIELVKQIRARSNMVFDVPAVSSALDSDLDARYLDPNGDPDGRGEKYPLKWAAMDTMLGGGCARKEFHLVVGPQGRGKSRWLNNLMVEYALSGLVVLYISFELSKQVIEHRTHCILTNLRSSDLATVDGVAAIKRGFSKIQWAGGNIFVQKFAPRSLTATGIISYARSISHRPDVLIIDYLGLMKIESSKGSPSYWLDQEIAYSTLAAGAEELNAIMWGADQPKKGVTGVSDRSEISGAGAKFDPVSSAWGIDVQGDELRRHGTFSLKNLKNRFGPEDVAYLQVMPNGLTVSEIEAPTE